MPTDDHHHDPGTTAPAAVPAADAAGVGHHDDADRPGDIPDHHDDTHGHVHAHGEDHGDHRHRTTERLLGIVGIGHSHDPSQSVDDALEASAQGRRAIKVSLVALALTAALQAAVVVVSGSVALLGDTLHNLADAFTAVPLWIAFVLDRRPANDRYTYGYGRAEDLAGVVIVMLMAASSAAAGLESVQRLVHPHPVHQLPAVMAAAVVGFLGNEAVAVYRVRVGRRIGSAALVADGMHARTDGLTSLAVLFGAVGVALGAPLADPVVGLVVTAAILLVLRSAARDIYRRLMDAVDPELVEGARRVLSASQGVIGVADLRVRWVGHRLLAEASLEVAADLTVADGHAVAEAAHHALLHHLPRLAGATIHADPSPGDGSDHHASTAHHSRQTSR